MSEDFKSRSYEEHLSPNQSSSKEEWKPQVGTNEIKEIALAYLFDMLEAGGTD